MSFADPSTTGLSSPPDFDPLKNVDTQKLANLQLVKTFKEELEQELKDLEEWKEDHPLIFTVPLDPRLHQMAFLSDNDQKKAVNGLEELLKKQVAQEEEQKDSIGGNVFMMAAMKRNTTSQKKRSIVEHFLSECNNANENDYLPKNPMDFWSAEESKKKFNKLGKIARKWLSASLVCPRHQGGYVAPIPDSSAAASAMLLKENAGLFYSDNRRC